MRLIILSLLISLWAIPAHAQEGCYVRLEKDTLRIGNTLIERTFAWNNGNLITHSLTDKSSWHTWLNRAKSPDFTISKDTKASNSSFSVREVAQTPVHPAYLEATVEYTLGGLDIRRAFRIYADAPAIACDTWLKGSARIAEGGKPTNVADMKNIEFTEDMKSVGSAAVLDQFKAEGQHWQTRVVEFNDVTDRNNNLVFETDIIPYRKNTYRGNLLMASNSENGQGLFFLKEAPCSGVQLAYGGYDFTAEFGHFAVTGLGMTGEDISPDEWRRTYGCVVGVSGGSELGQLTALRAYQKNLRRLVPGRDEMVMMNTWGDRSQDSKVNEKFSLLELERAARLGITHFQIDDGWQIGKSPNSAVAKGSFTNIWDNPDYWRPDPAKYPNGLHPIVERGKELGIEICLWFNPSVQHDYADWQKDAKAMVDLYNEYGIRTFKIDGLGIPTKQSEINLRRLFDRVLEQTGGNAVFNLDATAGRRAGYHMFNEYGNIFLENRYTDWQNYYPYWTLRNLWQLSKYVPAERLQIEFLNKWRNTAKYGADIFAPANYSFEYLFATTMAGQPLAWFEGTGLPDEALGISSLIASYKEVQHDFHSGTILPIGDEPSGRSWTGFQSIKDDRNGYFIFFRENTAEQKGIVDTWLHDGVRVRLTPILGHGAARAKSSTAFGHGKPTTRKTGPDGSLEIKLPSVNDFVMYKYEVLN